MRKLLLLAACSLAAAGCGSGGGESGPRAATRETPRTRAAKPRPKPVLRLPAAPGVRLPKGFRAQLYATGLHHPTAMAFGPDGRLYVTEEDGRVVSLRPGATKPRLVASGFPEALGLAWKGRALFVSYRGTLEQVLPRRRVLLAHLPNGLHQQDNVVLGRDGRLYLGNGSTCNACGERDPRSATILSVRSNGTDLRIVARGLRNPYGLAVDPKTGALYASVNGRDDIDRPGDPEPADTIVRIRRRADYGWPGCWASARLLRLVGDCTNVTDPVAYLEPHAAAAGLAFWRGDLYVAEWGQYDAARFGRRVVRVQLPGGNVTVFAEGLPHPLAVAVEPAGGLLVADWQEGAIYRFTAA